MPKQVFIATPAYDGNVTTDYKNSILESAKLCWQAGIEFCGCDNNYMSLLMEARGQLIEKFLESQADDIFFIDSDGGWDANGFMKVLLSPKDFVVGLLPKKNKDDRGNLIEDYPVFVDCYEDGSPIVDWNDGMISVSMIGCAFTRISREAIARMIEHYVMQKKIPRLFERVEDQSGNLMGEDYSFCSKWTAMGGKIWLVPDINFTHIGVGRWHGNYHEYLMRQPKPTPATGKFDIRFDRGSCDKAGLDYQDEYVGTAKGLSEGRTG